MNVIILMVLVAQCVIKQVEGVDVSMVSLVELVTLVSGRDSGGQEPVAVEGVDVIVTTH